MSERVVDRLSGQCLEESDLTLTASAVLRCVLCCVVLEQFAGGCAQLRGVDARLQSRF